MKSNIDDRIEDYLNGRLSTEESRRFENDLSRDDVAAAFREALVMREILNSLPHDEPPPGLVERIEASLELDKKGLVQQSKPKQAATGLDRVVSGFKWGFRWPRYALAGVSIGPNTVKGSFSGLPTVGYSLGPLQEPVYERMSSIRLPKKPFWKTALSKLW